DRLLVEKFTVMLIQDVEVSEEEIRAYYEEHKGEFLLPERVKVSQILLANEERAVGVRERLKDSTEEEFRKVAREESVGVEAAKGGEMGVFEMGQLPYEMEKVIFPLDVGELSPVLESSYGFHIFRLDARYEPELVSVEKAAPSIKARLLSQKIKQRLSERLEQLKKSMEWDIFPQNLYFSYQRIPDEQNP
ncbi:MAG: peptidylprolyl isomerase, partial [Candidatus Aminicenantales bacterium]